jgi:SAM-dependent methyltransferase
MDHASRSLDDPAPLAALVHHAFGPGKILHVGSGAGLLVQAMLKIGIDAHGVDADISSVAEGNTRMAGRFHPGSAATLPFGDHAFDAIICTDLQHADIAGALGEIARVTLGGLFLYVTNPPGREIWERQLFECGFRKHPRHYAIVPYEQLEDDGPRILLVAEKLPPAADHDPLLSLAAQRDLHMDMLRETGRRSDAHVARYQLAARYIRPGDVVLDAACGRGYGACVMRQNSLAKKVIGFDVSRSAIDYAQRNFGDVGGLEFHHGDLPSALLDIADHSVDYIASFETLEHLADPDALLAQFHRILRPGGRVIVSVPNEWTDETGKDPNPHHLQVYTWQRIVGDLSKHFLVDDAWQQIASGCRIAKKNGRWLPGPRRLRRTDPTASPDSEWCLLSAVKSPLISADKADYSESVFANVAAGPSAVARYAEFYRNPWILHSLVNIGYRMHSPALLEETAWKALADSPPDSADAGAALCILIYRADDRRDFPPEQVNDLSARVQRYLDAPSQNPHVLRWKISLAFAMGRLRTSCGQLDNAIAWYSRCAAMDSLAFSPHLATKTAEAYYEAGRLSLGLSRDEDAARFWRQGMEFARRLLAVGVDAVLINPDYPNLFDHGDGMREFTLVLDYLTRCGNGLHLLQRRREGYCVDWRALDRSLHSLTQNLQSELTHAQNGAAELTGQLESVRCELIERTESLDAVRHDLRDRTAELDAARHDLSVRGAEADAARRELLQRTAEVDDARTQLRTRTAEADEARNHLADRTAQADDARRALSERTDEVDRARRDLIARTAELDAARADLAARTSEVDDARRQLTERSAELDSTRQALLSRTGELDLVRRDLVGRTAELDAAREDLIARTAEVDDARQQLLARTREADTARQDLIDRTRELDDARKALTDRSAELDALRRTWWFKLHRINHPGGDKP